MGIVLIELGSGFQIPNSGVRVPVSGFRVQDLVLNVQDFGFKVRRRVQGSGFEVSTLASAFFFSSSFRLASAVS